MKISLLRLLEHEKVNAEKLTSIESSIAEYEKVLANSKPPVHENYFEESLERAKDMKEKIEENQRETKALICDYFSHIAEFRRENFRRPVDDTMNIIITPTNATILGLETKYDIFSLTHNKTLYESLSSEELTNKMKEHKYGYKIIAGQGYLHLDDDRISIAIEPTIDTAYGIDDKYNILYTDANISLYKSLSSEEITNIIKENKNAFKVVSGHKYLNLTEDELKEIS